MSKITQSAKGRNCTIRIPFICNHNNETTVYAHINSVRHGHGMAEKNDDLHGAYACSNCHAAVDGMLNVKGYKRNDLKLMHYEGVMETQNILKKLGLIEVK